MGVICMTVISLSKMSMDEKVSLILKSGDKNFIREFCGVSSSKFLMLEVSNKHALGNFIKNKVKIMPEETFEQKVRDLL